MTMFRWIDPRKELPDCDMECEILMKDSSVLIAQYDGYGFITGLAQQYLDNNNLWWRKRTPTKRYGKIK